MSGGDKKTLEGLTIDESIGNRLHGSLGPKPGLAVT